MRWEKCGRILSPQPEIWWMSRYAGPSFAKPSDDGWVIYVTGRDENNVSRIGRVHGFMNGESFAVETIEEDPVFDVGSLGTFDESGVSYPWIVEVQDRLLMFYVGWVSGGRNRFQNFTGMAWSQDDGSTWSRSSLVPLLDRSDEDPYGTGSCCVYRDGDMFHMIYTAFRPWMPSAERNRPTYVLKRAVSSDAVTWNRTGEVVVDFESPDEYVIGKPCVLDEPQARHLWYSYRGESYRIGYARAVEDGTFRRLDDLAGISVSESGWDAESVEYAHVFRSYGELWMIYNGNDFGRTGLGLARLKGRLISD